MMGPVALGGEPAVPCNLQSALAGLNSHWRVGLVCGTGLSGVDPRVPRKEPLRTGSGPGGSSPKEFCFCAAGAPGGSRLALVSELLEVLSGAEAALAVNNNAGAVLLALDTLASGREVIVSRGHLVEIGGSFRMPEIMVKSGARIVEVGTTNKTHLKDYARAITRRTALILNVHQSNFVQKGFVQNVPLPELVTLGNEHGVPVLDDQGSGILTEPGRLGAPLEPTIAASLEAGVVAVERVSNEDTKRYGIVETEPISGRVYRAVKLMEKPTPEQTVSRLGIVGRYIFTPEIFDMIVKTAPGAVNEIQITDAMQLILDEQKFYAYELEGIRHDTGTPVGWLKANIAYALKRDDIGPELREYLRQLG